jgi:NAD(P)-dependent dehydrogenase (short-subunit alcohol dehydrogenase family)
MNHVDVITGAGSGIGAALSRALLARGDAVIGVGRRADALRDTGAGAPGFQAVAADVSTPLGRDAVADAVAGRRVRYLVHNAGVLPPVGRLMDVDPEQWRYAQAVNVEGPLFLTQRLLPWLPGGRVLHVSSGAAHRPVRGWGAYCTSKAALYMVYRLLAEELAGRGIAVGSLRPGVVDTPMQALIRGQSETDFPDVARFRALKTDAALTTPQRVAEFVLAVLERTDDGRFSAQEWDIREHAGELLP